MNPPTSPKPYDLLFQSETRYYGKVDNMRLIEGLEIAWFADKARHTVEWLEYDLHCAKESLKKALKENEAWRDECKDL